MNRTVNRTVQYLKDKYSTSKKVALDKIDVDTTSTTVDKDNEVKVEEENVKLIEKEQQKEEEDKDENDKKEEIKKEYKEEKYLGDVVDQLKTGTKKLEDFYNEKRKSKKKKIILTLKRIKTIII